MSRSRRKIPIHGITTARSEKKDKRIMNRILRRRAKILLDQELEGYVEPLKDEVMNLWSMDKDGKTYWKKPPDPPCPSCFDRVRCITDNDYKDLYCKEYWLMKQWEKMMRK